MKSNIKKISILAILVIVLSITFINPTSATSAGVSPPKIIINNAQPGNDYNLTFAVYNMGNQTTDYSIEVDGNISNWTYIDAKKLTVGGNMNIPIKGVIRVPSNAAIGNYTGNILIKSIPNSSISGNKVSVGVNLPIIMNITVDNSSTAPQNNSTNTSSIDRSPAFPYLVAIIVILILGAIYFMIRRAS